MKITFFNHSDYSIICSEKRLKQISNIKTNKICIIHNSPMKFEVKDYKFQFSNRVKIVYVGILGENRMIRELVEVVKKDSSMELHIGGFGPLDSFISDASNKYENIVFYGKIPYQKTIYLEQKCDIIPALYSPRVKNHVYAAPNKFYEAGFLGKPTIMIKNSGMSELVDSNHLGLTIEDNKESLRNALAKIVNEIDYWKLQSETIKEYYEINFSWEEMSKRLVYLYDDLEKDKC